MSKRMNVTSGVGSIYYAINGATDGKVKLFSSSIIEFGLSPQQESVEVWGSDTLGLSIPGEITGDVSITTNGIEEEVIIEILNKTKAEGGGYIDNGQNPQEITLMIEEKIGVNDIAYLTLYRVILNNIETKAKTRTSGGVSIEPTVISGKAFKGKTTPYKYVNSTLSEGFNVSAWGDIWGITVPVATEKKITE